jgi:hypothetical protein
MILTGEDQSIQREREREKKEGLSQCQFVNQNLTCSGLGLNTDLNGQKLVTESWC